MYYILLSHVFWIEINFKSPNVYFNQHLHVKVWVESHVKKRTCLLWGIITIYFSKKSSFLERKVIRNDLDWLRMAWILCFSDWCLQLPGELHEHICNSAQLNRWFDQKSLIFEKLFFIIKCLFFLNKETWKRKTATLPLSH